MGRFIKTYIKLLGVEVYIDLSKIALVYPNDNTIVMTATHGLGSGILNLDDEAFEKVMEYTREREHV